MQKKLKFNVVDKTFSEKDKLYCFIFRIKIQLGAQWLSGRVLESRLSGRGSEPHRRHCVVSLSKNINPSFVLVQPRKTHLFITERLMMGRKESIQTNRTKIQLRVRYQTCHSYTLNDFYLTLHFPKLVYF